MRELGFGVFKGLAKEESRTACKFPKRRLVCSTPGMNERKVSPELKHRWLRTVARRSRQSPERKALQVRSFGQQVGGRTAPSF